jgi:1-phosphofructokinase family hexose kinase
VILTVTPNPALDVTYEIEKLVPGEEHRVKTVHTRPGGKGVNVARVLSLLGTPCRVLGLAGGATGALLRAELQRQGLDDALLDTGVETRRTVVVVGAGVSTSLWEPGPTLPASETDRLVSAVSAAAPEARAVVISGSLPPGLPADVHRRVARAAIAAGLPVLVDADGAALAAAAQTPGVLFKPNAAELGRLTGRPVSGVRDALAAVAVLRSGARSDWVVTLGAKGMVAGTSGGTWAVSLPKAVDGTPTGAGDAAAAALARALASTSDRPMDWPAALADAVALSAAAVKRPVAGEVDVAAYTRWRGQVRVQELAVPTEVR